MVATLKVPLFGLVADSVQIDFVDGSRSRWLDIHDSNFGRGTSTKKHFLCVQFSLTRLGLKALGNKKFYNCSPNI